jgi:DNA primase catalytic core
MITNIQQIKDNVSIENVLDWLGHQLDSRQRCACPVHNGKGRNFSIKNGYGTCFSNCGGTSWDAVGLLMEVKSLTFPEAIEQLAAIGKMQVEYAEGVRSNFIEAARVERDRRKILSGVMAEVVAHYVDTTQFVLSDDSVDLDGRIYRLDTLKKFSIAIANEKHILSRIAYQKWAIPDLLEIGALRKNDGDIWDTFTNRILFPIQDERGQYIGLAGRKRKSDTRIDIPKYINSKESILYSKSNTLYGLHQNRKAIREAEQVYILEGYTDVLTTSDYGIQNTVATCGTALTEGMAALIRKYTERAILLFDADGAGIQAAQKAIPMLTKAGLVVEFCLLPKGEDPDSYLRANGQDAFLAHIAAQKQDGILWLVKMAYTIKDDPFFKEKAINVASELIGLIQNEVRKDNYIEMVSKETKLNKKTICGRLKELSEKQKISASLTLQQQKDIRLYGVYEQNNTYIATMEVGGNGFPITNFVIKPIMLIIGNDKSHRLVEITNEFKKSFIADINTDAFVELTAFKKELARRGNYLYTSKTADYFMRIQAKIYAETAECYPINTLGWHKEGFYAWGNGITNESGNFTAVNEYGIVQHGEIKYFLPAFSKIKTGGEDESSYEDEKEFIFVSGQTLSFQEWTRRFCAVHGDNGMMGVCYFIAALYRDIIYEKFNYFPHLNLFGPPGAGKSFMAWSLQAMFGKPKTPFHLVQGTNVGFFRRLAKVRNGISWFDEYSNDVPFNRVEALKAAYDGVGHEKGDKNDSTSVVRTKVKSACIISGQQQPTQDVALFKRCISLNFPRFEKSDERDARGRALRDVEQTHRLGQITGILMKFRSTVESNFAQKFDEVRSEISPMMKGEASVEDRILNNYLIPMTIYRILSQFIEFDFDWKSLSQFAVKNIIAQSNAISSQDELSVWWKMFQYMAEMDLIKHQSDFIVQETDSLTVVKGKAKEILSFDRRTVVFVRFEKAHSLYLEAHKRQYSKNGLPESSLKYYLKGSPAFLGEIKAKKFNGLSKYCWAFDMDMAGVNMPLTQNVETADTESA